MISLKELLQNFFYSAFFFFFFSLTFFQQKKYFIKIQIFALYEQKGRKKEQKTEIKLILLVDNDFIQFKSKFKSFQFFLFVSH